MNAIVGGGGPMRLVKVLAVLGLGLAASWAFGKTPGQASVSKPAPPEQQEAEEECGSNSPMTAAGAFLEGQRGTLQSSLEWPVFRPSGTCAVLTTRKVQGRWSLTLTFRGNLGARGNLSLSLQVEQPAKAFLKNQAFRFERQNERTSVVDSHATGEIDLFARIPVADGDRGMSYTMHASTLVLTGVDKDGRVTGVEFDGGATEDLEASEKLPKQRFHLSVPGEEVAAGKAAAAPPAVGEKHQVRDSIEWGNEKPTDKTFGPSAEDTRRCGEALENSHGYAEAHFWDPSFRQVCFLKTRRPGTIAFRLRIRRQKGEPFTFACELYRELAPCWRGLPIETLSDGRRCAAMPYVDSQRSTAPNAFGFGSCLLGRSFPLPDPLFEKKAQEEAAALGKGKP